MTNTLIIKCSILSTNIVSSAVADAFVAIAKAKHPDDAVTSRDFGAEPLPRLHKEVLGANAL